MTRKSTPQSLNLINLAIAFSLGLAFVSQLQTPVLAEPSPVTPEPTLSFIPPPETPGAPDGRSSAGGATRGNCSTLDSQSSASNHSRLTLLTPSISPNRPRLTSVEYPTFLIYLPPTQAEAAEFTLVDQEEEYSYQTTFPLKQTAGIISFQLPPEAPPLEPNKTYTWKVAIICDRQSRTEDVFAQEQVQFIELQPEQVQQLETATPLEQVALYGELGIWYDMMKILAELRRSQPDKPEIMLSWNELLQSKTVGLTDIAPKPLINCCTVEN
ncbi:MAG: DUF928 domain-containing protein [Coleofasciculus sp. B1-GNL1-01]|uniref:DUF928 domain-containing protein n=1 Tax=Coleofasciculus sp. B1-GNL1-01 TaxID=3068484 RepID=UPI003300C34A